MMKKNRRLWLWLSGCLSLSGCFFQSVDDLYHLPQKSSEYEQLMTQITTVRASLEQTSAGVEYANILSGDNTSTIQLQNLGGAGEVDTAITFFRVPTAENPLKIFFFVLDEEGDYVPYAMIEGQGASILSVEFEDLNGTGKSEIIVNWQNNQLGVYSLDYVGDSGEGLLAIPEATQLLATNHSNYILSDLDQNGVTDLSVVRLDTGGVNSFVEFYHWAEGAMETHSIAALSAGITSLSSSRANFITGNVPALYVTSNLVDGGRTTDILTLDQGRLSNLTMDLESGMSVGTTLREYINISPTDINNDGILEMPNPVPLPTYTEEEIPAPTSFWLIDWTQYNSHGVASEVYTTYHNVADGWYFIIPDHWKGQISVSRDDSIVGQRTVIFSKWNEAGSQPTPFLTIYKLTGTNRYTRADLPDRFELGGDSTTIYAASFIDESWDCELDAQDVLQRFHQIMTSWG